MSFRLTRVIYLILGIYVLSAWSTKKELKEYDWNVWCKFQPNSNICTDHGYGSSRYYYDIKLEGCKTFEYGGCPNSYNNFDSLKSCYESCRDAGVETLKDKDNNLTANVYCRLQPDFGKCNNYHPRFYFDINERKCRGFSYSGCGGNKNRFLNAQLCTALCASEFEF